MGYLDWAIVYPEMQAARKAANMEVTDIWIRDAAGRARLRPELMPKIEEGMKMLYKALDLDPQYDDAMAWFERKQVPPDAGILYLRAMESWRRYGVRSDARKFLEEALNRDPKMVRAQAKLALMGEEIADLQKLQVMAPSHIIVNIAGPTLWREHEIAMSLARARAADLPSPYKTKP